jgi:hypothetical protein
MRIIPLSIPIGRHRFRGAVIGLVAVVLTAAAVCAAGISPALAATHPQEQSAYEYATSRSLHNDRTSIPHRYRQTVARSVDPDGFIVKPELRNQLDPLGPPSCVEAQDDHPTVGLATVTVTSSCPIGQRVKVLIAFWFDSACLITPPKSTVQFQYANGARFDGLVAC